MLEVGKVVGQARALMLLCSFNMGGRSRWSMDRPQPKSPTSGESQRMLMVK